MGGVSQVSVMMSCCVMMGGRVMVMVVIESGCVSVIGFGLGEKVVLLLLIRRLLVAHSAVQLLLVLLLLRLTFRRLVIAVPKRRRETSVSHR